VVAKLGHETETPSLSVVYALKTRMLYEQEHDR